MLTHTYSSRHQAGYPIGTFTLVLVLILTGALLVAGSVAANSAATETEAQLSDLTERGQTSPVEVEEDSENIEEDLDDPKEDSKDTKEDSKDTEGDSEPSGAKTASYYAEGWVGPEGGQVQVKAVYEKDQTKLKFAPGALDEETLITMRITTDHLSFVEFEFGPHTPKFGAEVQLELSWAYLPADVTEQELMLYYWNGDVWQPEVTGTWSGDEKKVRLFLDHFSRYYFERR